MTDGFQYGDIIFLGLIALFVALRLRGMLGKNSGIDPREIWKQASRTPQPQKAAIFPERIQKRPLEASLVPEAILHMDPVVATGLQAINKADASFSTTDFIAGARLAFDWVVDAFAAGDKDKLRGLLSDECFRHFASDIDARAGQLEIHTTTLVSIESADITEAALIGTRAQITVQFTTEQIHVVRDKEKNVVGGDPSAIEKVIDVWTFERDISSRDPNWKIVTT